MRQRLWWLLPGFHIVLALILSYWGSSVTRSRFGDSHPTDYVASPEFVLHVINLPPAAAVCLISNKWTFELGPEYSKQWFVVYLAFIGLFWSFIGMRIGLGGPFFQFPSKASNAERLFGVFLGAIVLLLGVILIRHPLGYFLPLTCFAWGISLIVLFRRTAPSASEAR